mgnify:CR=1 FL=1
MLKIICGQNTIGAYQYFLDEKNRLKKAGFETIEIDPQQLEEIFFWQKDNLSLFSQKKAFFTRNLNKKINKKNERQKKIIEKIIEDKNLILIDFEEDLEKWELKITNKKVEIKEFKLPTSIFDLLDDLYPKNVNSFIKSFNLLTKKIPQELIFYMIIKRVRQLLQIKFNQKIENLQSWQFRKLNFQAKLWPKEKLIKLYESLFNMEKKIKTGATPFDLKESLELLLTYLLS